MNITLFEQELTTFEITMAPENFTAFNVEDLLAVNESLTLFGQKSVQDRLLNVDGVMYVHLDEYDTCLNPNSFYITIENEVLEDEDATDTLIAGINAVLGEIESLFIGTQDSPLVKVATVNDLQGKDDFEKALNLMSHTSGFKIIERNPLGECSIIQFDNGLFSELEVTCEPSETGLSYHFYHSLRFIHNAYKEENQSNNDEFSFDSIELEAINIYCTQRGLEFVEINDEETRFTARFPQSGATEIFFVEPAVKKQGVYISLLVSDNSGCGSIREGVSTLLEGISKGNGDEHYPQNDIK